MELKIDTLWELQIRIGKAEGIRKGLFEEQSPLQLTPQGRDHYQQLAADLHSFWWQEGQHLETSQGGAALLAEVERRFGERLFREVCLPAQVHDAACLVGAMLLLQEARERGRHHEDPGD